MGLLTERHTRQNERERERREGEEFYQDEFVGTTRAFGSLIIIMNDVTCQNGLERQ